MIIIKGPFALDDNDFFFVIFPREQLHRDHATHFKSCADDIKSLFHCRQVRTDPNIYILTRVSQELTTHGYCPGTKLF